MAPDRRSDYLALSARSARRLSRARDLGAVGRRCEARTAALLPGLLLARVDGKSPVEYLTDERDREAIRAVRARLICSTGGKA